MKYLLSLSQLIKLPKLLKRHHLSFIDATNEAENIYTYRFKKPAELEYRAGQHFIFKLPHDNKDRGGNTRLFSVSSAPHENHIAFTARYLGDEGSSFKRALHALNRGEIIYARGPSPFNDFFDIDELQEYVFVIGGIGVTPLRSVLIDAAQTKKKITASVLWANSSKDIPSIDDFEIIHKQLKSVTVTNITSPTHIEAEDIKRVSSNYKSPEFIISGTPGFTKAMRDILINTLRIDVSKVSSYSYEAGLGMGGGYDD